MELAWACSLSVWLLFLGSLAVRLLRSDLLLSRRLLLHMRVGLLAVLQALGQAVLPLPLSTALTAAACWLVSVALMRPSGCFSRPRRLALLVAGCSSVTRRETCQTGRATAAPTPRLGRRACLPLLGTPPPPSPLPPPSRLTKRPLSPVRSSDPGHQAGSSPTAPSGGNASPRGERAVLDDEQEVFSSPLPPPWPPPLRRNTTPAR
ncbi:uncharacterized protein M6D78_007050 [Vipera latastei]